MSSENALVDKAENFGTVEASYNFTSMSAIKLSAIYEECYWPFDEYWNKDYPAYPVLCGVDEAAQANAILVS